MRWKAKCTSEIAGAAQHTDFGETSGDSRTSECEKLHHFIVICGEEDCENLIRRRCVGDVSDAAHIAGCRCDMGFDEPATLLSKFASRKQKTVFAFVDTERFDDDGNQLYAQLSKKAR